VAAFASESPVAFARKTHYIGKAPRYDELAERLRLAAQDRQRARQLEVHRLPASEFLGMGPELEEVKSLAGKAIDRDIPVLILGETGTGKSLLARSIHRWSRNRPRPFRDVNVAALSSELLASEIFGHERGAFTGAVRQRLGLF